MANITKGKTWVDNENVTYTDLNSNFDTIYNEFNGNVDNANIKTSANIAPTKISGTAATLGGTETLTNKTLTSPTINNGTLASPTITTPTTSSPTINTTIIVNDVYALGNLTGAVTIDPANSDRQGGTLTGNVTLTLTAPASNKLRTITLYFLEDAAGGHTITFSTSVTWQDAVTPTWTTSANKLNIMVLYFDGENWWGMGAKFA